MQLVEYLASRVDILRAFPTHLGRTAREFGSAVADRAHGKSDPYRVGGIILVFDLGLRKRGLLDDAPHDRLRTAVEQAVRREFHDLARDLRFGGETHRRIRMIPVADHAEALEFLALHIDPMRRKGAALIAELIDRHLVLVFALGAIFLLDLPFDRQAVTIPARHVIGILAEHLLGTGDEILQDLVQRMTDMDVAVGVRRPIMQHEAGASGGKLRATSRTVRSAASARESPAPSAEGRHASGNRSAADTASRNNPGRRLLPRFGFCSFVRARGRSDLMEGSAASRAFCSEGESAAARGGCLLRSPRMC